MTDRHSPTIVILLCAGRNDNVARYSLAGSTAPLAVADYIYDALPEAAREAVPTDHSHLMIRQARRRNAAAIAHQLDLTVIAEGVETQQQVLRPHRNRLRSAAGLPPRPPTTRRGPDRPVGRFTGQRRPDRKPVSRGLLRFEPLTKMRLSTDLCRGVAGATW